MQPRRFFFFLLLLASGCAAATAADPPSASTGPQALALVPSLASGEGSPITAVLEAVRAGHPAGLATLDLTAFTAAPALADAHDPALETPWTTALAQAIAVLPAPARAEALAILDDRCRRCLADLSAQRRAAAAVRFLPADAAVAELAHAAAAAFDHGDLRRSLAIDALLDVPSGPLAERDLVAARLAGLGPGAADGDDACAAPGLPLPATAPAPAPTPAPDQDRGITVTWVVTPGLLIAADPWAGVRWQRRCPDQAEVVCGEGGAVVRADGHMRLIDENGVARDLAIAGDTAILAVRGGAAWFARGPEVFRVDVATAGVDTWTLPDAPLAPPLVRGSASLWLTGRQLLLYHHVELHAGIRHGLSAGPGWRLGMSGGTVVMGDAADHWRVPPIADQLAAAASDAAQRIVLLHAAGRDDEALHEASVHPGTAAADACHRALLEACFAHGLTAGTRDLAFTLARSPAERIAVHYAACGGRPPWPAPLLDGLRALPTVLLPRDPRDLAEAPARWTHAVSGEALLDAATDPAPGAATVWPATCNPDHPVAEPTAAPPTAGTTPATHFSVTQEADVTETALTAADGSLLWRHRWPALPVASGVPNRAHAIGDGMAMIGEGGSRLVVLDLRLGDQVGVIDFNLVDTDPARTRMLGVDGQGVLHVAMLYPVAIDDHVVVASSAGLERVVALPARARWLLRAPGDCALVGLVGGDAVLIDDSGVIRPIAIPTIMRSATAPVSGPAGVTVGDDQCPWQR